MRPKKKILLIDANPDRLAMRRLVLEIRRFKVLSAENRREALDACAEQLPDVTLMVMPIDGAAGLAQALRHAGADVPLAVIAQKCGPTFDSARELFADAVLAADVPAIDLIDQLKLLAICKRGPKKQPASVPFIEAEVRRLA